MTYLKCIIEHDPMYKVATMFINKTQNLSFSSSKLMFCFYLNHLHKKIIQVIHITYLEHNQHD